MMNLRTTIGGLLVFSVLAGLAAHAQQPRWTWMSGLNHRNYSGNHGSLGVPAAGNWPGARSGAAAWTDAAGRLVLLGGASPSGPGTRNDLWRYNPSTGLWVWLKGGAELDRQAVFGERGTPHPANTPGACSGMAAWRDAQGRLWMFGGDGTDANGAWGLLNALWRWDPATGDWTWMRGSSERDQPGLYGVKGQEDSGVKPGSRRGATAWTDGAGRFWLFGGEGYDAAGNWGCLNDLWRFDPAGGLWAWMGGTTAANSPGFYGIPGTPDPANMPGGRSFAASWTDAQGRFWLYGGGSPYWLVGDLWRYDPDTGMWTWIKGDGRANTTAVPGIQGIASPDNTPGGRAWAAAWLDRAGRLCLFGGLGIDTEGHRACMGDLWRYDPAPGAWTWVKDGPGGPDGTPAARWQAMTWTDTIGQVWLFGGEKLGARGLWERLNDLWRFTPATQTWTRMGGANLDRLGNYGTPGIERPENTPGARWGAAAWTGRDGRFWLLGGWGHDAGDQAGPLNDLWRMDPATRAWTWVRGGDYTNAYGTFRPQGIETPDGQPGCRRDATAWTDPNGRLWVFGGFGGSNISLNHFLNDLWRFNPDTGNWTWMTGSFEPNMWGYYGERGSEDTGSTPGARLGAAGWADGAGRIWLFGGEGLDGDGVRGQLGDLWRFNPAARAWTWAGGSSRRDQAGVYGRLGVADAGAMPGARQGAAAWTDRMGRFWLFGGWGLDGAGAPGYLGDLWRYDPAAGWWAWMGGAASANPKGAYGPPGEAAPAAFPGGRMRAGAWVDPAGRLCLLGGVGLDGAGAAGMLGDLWRYDPATGAWSWLGGAAERDRPGRYGVLGETGADSTPGGRADGAIWAGPAGLAWMFGGQGVERVAGSGALMDLWRLSGTSAARRGAWAKME